MRCPDADQTLGGMTDVAERPEPVARPVSARFPAGAGPGWRSDPSDSAQERYWDGHHWAEEVRLVGSLEPNTRGSTLAAARRARRSRRERRTRPWLHTLGFLTRTGLVLTVIATAVNALWQVHQYNVVSVAVLGTSSQDEIHAALSDVTGTTLRLTVVVAVVHLLSLAFFLAWVVGVYTDPRTSRELLRHGALTAVLAGFIPVLQLWWPMQVVSDAWNATDSKRHHTRPPPAPSVLGWWVLTLLSVAVPVGLTTWAYVAGAENDVLPAAAVGTILSAVLYGMAQVCLVIAIGHISWHLEAHAIRDRAAYVRG